MNKKTFIKYALIIIEKELKEHLPEEATEYRMLDITKKIAIRDINHILEAIAKGGV